MEQTLRCNNQIGGFCRAELIDVAVVTTCSHIFCEPCAKKTGFANSHLHQRACPVCRSPLPKMDDAVQTRLSPTEDYKTSVLSGLDPTTIMECAGRAMAFWAYQATQEIVYQEHLCKNMTDKYGRLSNAMNNVIQEANTEIQGLQDRMSDLAVKHDTVEQKYNELSKAYQEKSKACSQAQQLYAALKAKHQRERIGTAPTENIARTIEAISGHHSRPGTYQDRGEMEGASIHKTNNPAARYGLGRDQVVDAGAGLYHTRQRSQASSELHGMQYNMAPPARPGPSTTPHHGVDSTTPQHRTTLPGAQRQAANRSAIPLSTSRAEVRTQDSQYSTGHGSSLRHQLTADGSRSRNTYTSPRFHGGGILGGMKVGGPGTAGGVGSQGQGEGVFQRDGSTFAKSGPLYH